MAGPAVEQWNVKEDDEMEKEINRNELLKNKKELIEKFLSLTEKQQELIKENNFDSVINIINEKQSVIEKVNLIDINLKNLVNKKNDNNELFSEIKMLVEKALEIDEENIKKLKNNSKVIAEKLKNARKNTKTHNLYRGKNAAVGGIMLDKKK
jgi:hypothetical protein